MRIPILLYLVLFSLLISCSEGLSQKGGFRLAFDPINISDPDFNRPGAGAEQWNDQNLVNIPDASVSTQRMDAYYRFSFTDIAVYSARPNTYDFSFFDSKINDAIEKGQKFSFCIMQMCSTCSQGGTISGARLYYPLYLHNQMQTEPVRDWNKEGLWIPNYNSPSWLEAWKALNAAVNDHIMKGSFHGIQYKNIIGYVDVSGYGDYGEWTNNSLSGPMGTVATIATLDSIISFTVHQYRDFRCVALIATFDGNTLKNTMVPPAVGYYALTVYNNVGLIGWRRDSWGFTDYYNSGWTDKNPTVFNGFRFDTAINNRYKYAPIVGEPADMGLTNFNGKPFGDLARQILYYHVNSFGNGNLDQSVINKIALDNIRTASKYAGYRLILNEGTMTKLLVGGTLFYITLSWQNTGAAPTYENWEVFFELRNTGNEVAWSAKSKFNPKLFLPLRSATSITDNFALPASVPPGNYNLYLIVRDPKGYRKPLPLFISGRNPDGSYLIRSNVAVDSDSQKLRYK
jgi:hypothetical protein